MGGKVSKSQSGLFSKGDKEGAAETEMEPLLKAPESVKEGAVSQVWKAIVNGKTQDAIQILNDKKNSAVDWNVVNNIGANLAHVAAKHGNSAILEKLHEKGVDFSIKAHGDQVPLDVAKTYHPADYNLQNQIYLLEQEDKLKLTRLTK